MTSELKPCPFCGGEAGLYISPAKYGWKYAFCKKCFSSMDDYDTEAEAVEAWNTRAERTCKPEVYTDTAYGEERNAILCGKCGGFLSWEIDWEDLAPNYCQDCGAKVVKHGQEA